MGVEVCCCAVGIMDFWQGNNYKLKFGQISIPQPVEMVLLIKERKRLLKPMHFKGIKQVHMKLIKDKISFPYFLRVCESRDTFSVVDDMEFECMMRLGAVAPKAYKAHILSCSQMLIALRYCKVSSDAICGFKAMLQGSGNLTELPLLVDRLPPGMEGFGYDSDPQPSDFAMTYQSTASILCQQPSPSQLHPSLSTTIQMSGPLPPTLPVYKPSPMEGRQYGLFTKHPAMLGLSSLKEQVADYKAWCTNSIQLDRPSKAYASKTWQNSWEQMSLFLGHCHIFQGVHNQGG